MSGFLLDTSVLSIFAPDRPRVPQALQQWVVLQGGKNALFISSIVLLEIQRGIAKLRRAGGIARAERLDEWLSTLLVDFARQILSVDADVARAAGELEDSSVARGNSPGLADILIATTARSHGLTIVTLNTRHFDALGVKRLDPLADELPAG